MFFPDNLSLKFQKSEKAVSMTQRIKVNAVFIISTGKRRLNFLMILCGDWKGVTDLLILQVSFCSPWKGNLWFMQRFWTTRWNLAYFEQRLVCPKSKYLELLSLAPKYMLCHGVHCHRVSITEHTFFGHRWVWGAVRCLLRITEQRDGGKGMPH